MGVIWPVAMYKGEYSLNITCPVSDCFQRLVSNTDNITTQTFITSYRINGLVAMNIRLATLIAPLKL